MTLSEKILLIHRAHNLIKRRATGGPKDISKRLGICERDWYRLLSEMKNMGFPILWSKKDREYYYETEVTFIFNVQH